MEKGYYWIWFILTMEWAIVAIHNKNGKGLLLNPAINPNSIEIVAIHNKNGKGLLRKF